MCRILPLFFVAGCLRGQAALPVLLWPRPVPIEFPAPLSAVQLDATAVAGHPVNVPLSSFYNVMGITTAGFSFYSGFDLDNSSYPAELLGNSLSWRGVSFPLGAPNVPNAVSGATVALPEGSYKTLLMLGALVNNQQPPMGTFRLTYTDGTGTALTQSMSDWVYPRNYPGESVVGCMPYRYVSGQYVAPVSVCVYGYAMVLDPAKTVASLELPEDRDIVMLGFALVPPEIPGTITYEPPAGTVLGSGTSELKASFVPTDASAWTSASATSALTVSPPKTGVAATIAWPTLQPIVYGTELGAAEFDATAMVEVAPAAFSLNQQMRTGAIAEDGVAFELTGFDGLGDAYSSRQLGDALRYAGGNFSLGAPLVPDAVTSTAIALPPGSFDTVYLLGAANGDQIAQPFTVNYGDGSTSSTSLSLSDWTQPKNFSGETVVATTAYAATSAGDLHPGTYNVYGYQVPVDAAKTATSLSLPQNLNVMVLAAGVGTSHAMAAVPGAFVYTPGAGTILAAGTQPLGAAFTPADSTDYSGGTATNSLDVLKAMLVVSANSGSRIYGGANPVFSGNVAGAVDGEQFSESFSTPATALSDPGRYAIVPSAVGQDAADYQETVVDGTLTVAKAPVTVGVSSAMSAVEQGQSETLIAGVQSTTSGTPTGTVTFLGNGIPLGSAQLSQGVAKLVTAMLPPGANAVSVTYAGDVDFLAGSANGTTVKVEAFDFSLKAQSGTTLTVPWGSRGTLWLDVAPLGLVYESNVTFAAGELDPQYSSASFSPGIVASTAGPNRVGVTVSMVSLSRLMKPRSNDTSILAGFDFLLLLPVAASRRLKGTELLRRRTLSLLLMVTAGLATLGGPIGCGSGYYPFSTPFTVTATDGTHTHSMTLTLKIVPPQ